MMNIKQIIQLTYTKAKVHRWIAWLLCIALVGGMVGTALPALAVNDDGEETYKEETDEGEAYEEEADKEETLCEHHPVHTEECGYEETVEGQPCTHVHDGYCGYTESVEGQFCTHVHDGECGYVEEHPCTHVHDEECGYVKAVEAVEAVEGRPCTHEHDEECGYEEAVGDEEGQPCTHEHNGECGYVEAVEAVEAVEGQPCTHEHNENCGYAEGQPCTHEHGEECGYEEGQPCTHEHDEECGYVEAVEGQPCQFVCEICGRGSEQIATMAAKPMPVDAGSEDGLIAHFKFDAAENRLGDYSGKGVEAALHKVNSKSDDIGLKEEITSDNGEDWNKYFDGTGDNANALHLDDTACLVLKENGAFSGLTEITIQMRIKVNKRDLLDTDGNDQNWLFYTAPNTNDPGNFLGSFIGTDEWINIARTTGNAVSKAEFPSEAGGFKNDKWYTVTAIYKVSSIALYIDEKRVVEEAAPYKVADYFEDGKTLWFGHSAWPDPNFNGYIDDIKIYDYANYEGLDVGPIDEEKYIITDRVADPANTTVNMFDYWITGQLDNDYRPELTLDEVRDGGINEGHLFLFAGSDGAKNEPPYYTNLNSSANVGSWNSFMYTEPKNNHKTYEPFQGIVDNVLSNGYPRLAIEELKAANMFYDTVDSVWYGARNPAESLAYLFDPKLPSDNDSDGEGKAYYPDVTGLFRLDNDGYYYFRSNEAFAELNTEQSIRPKISTEDNHITLYKKTWKVRERGQFYPFNDWSNLFYQSDADELGLKQSHLILEQSTTAEPLNHYFGMTVETEFQQPTNGKFDRGTAEPESMKFEFSGDDDVWIFIDDVLVGDLGGLHQRIRVTIDFSTGVVDFLGELADDGINGTQPLKKFDTTLRQAFGNAGKLNDVEWNNDNNELFADGSVHTLKFFYLERGNNESNCSISFNLMEPPTDRIRKTDENGDPLPGAKFELYEARYISTGTVNSNEWWHTADEFEAGKLLTTVTSGSDGYAELTDNNGGPITFEGGKFYILKETGTPKGYRTNPPIVLQFHGNTSTFIVVNKYEAGAYASFLSHWTYYEGVNYAVYAPNGTFGKGGSIGDNDLSKGLAVMVPLYKQTAGNDFVRWLPLYGSNTNGWYTIADSYQRESSGNTEADFIKDVALAAILQIADTDKRTPNWYLNYFEGGKYYDAYMENLPGDATRYEDGGDLRLVTLFLSEEVLKSWGLSDLGAYDGDGARYRALQEALRTRLSAHTEAGAKSFLDSKNSTLRFLYSDEFTRSNRSVIYIPNEQRELRVRKTNPDGNYIDGAVFAIFDTWQEAVNYKPTAATADGVMAELQGKALSYGITSTITQGTQEEKGLLIFREDNSAGAGYAKIDWPSQRSGGGDESDSVLWMKEVFAPEGYTLNENLVRIEVGNIAIYANATGYDSKGKILPNKTDDGITVEASLGKLSQTLVKYALGNKVDVTLQDITITKQFAPNTSVGGNGELVDADHWEDVTFEKYDLHYGRNADALTSQYGLHDSDYQSGTIPVFTAGDGYIRVMPRQNQNVPSDGAHESGVHKANLTKNGSPIDLGNLFGLMNTVVVEDKLTEEPPKEEPPEKEPPGKKPPTNPPTKRPPKEDKPTDPPEVQPPKENTLIGTSTAQEEEKKPIGVLASPRTGDSKMVVLWFALLVFSTAGIITLTRVRSVRKREDEQE